MRHEDHILETIACRTFERALSPRIVCNPPLQGRDYGWDYQCTDFDKAGEISREFKAQVKHLNKLIPVHGDEAPYVRHYHILKTSHPSLAKYELKVSQIKTWINPQKTAVPTLFIQADKTRVVFAWLQDIHQFHLRWIPLDDQDSVTVYLTDLHQMQDRDGNVTLGLNAEPDWDGWIDERIAPGNLDAVFHMGMSLYFRYLCRGDKFVRDFDANGFFQMLVAESNSKPWHLLAFASFLGALPPSDAMEEWAFNVVVDWNRPWFIPAAIQILSQSSNSKRVEPIYQRFKNETPSREGARAYDAMIEEPWRRHASSRFVADFGIAAGVFLERRVRKFRCEQAQQLLVDAFRSWDPHTMLENAATPALDRLIIDGVIIKNDSYKQLVQFCHRFVNADPTLKQIKEAIYQEDSRWIMECNAK